MDEFEFERTPVALIAILLDSWSMVSRPHRYSVFSEGKECLGKHSRQQEAPLEAVEDPSMPTVADEAEVY